MGFLYRKFLGIEETLTEDVMRNVGNLLRAKRGAASLLPRFGVTETGIHSAVEMLAQLTQEIRENIALYEPRLEITEIEQDEEGVGGRPRLVMHCLLRASRQPLALVIDPRTRALSLEAAARPEEA